MQRRPRGDKGDGGYIMKVLRARAWGRYSLRELEDLPLFAWRGGVAEREGRGIRAICPLSGEVTHILSRRPPVQGCTPVLASDEVASPPRESDRMRRLTEAFRRWRQRRRDKIIKAATEKTDIGEPHMHQRHM